MPAHKTQLRVYYIISRLAAASLVLLCSHILPPFDTSHLRSQSPSQTPFGLSSALLRWDSFHFSSIALHGYTQEQQFAFLPGVPFITRLFAEIGLYLASLMGLSNRGFTDERDVLLGGAAAAFLLCDWTSDMYDLTMAITRNPSTAFLATSLTLLPLSPPALLFAGYTDPFFASLSYKGMLACERKQWFKATACFMIATAFRANGVMLAGFLIWGIAVDPMIRRFSGTRKVFSLKGLLSRILFATGLSIAVALPFAAHQYYAYAQFCTPSFSDGASSKLRPWCSNWLPLIYPFVQRQYWNVGFFRYWEMSQVPNFILAAPVLVLVMSTSISEIMGFGRSVQEYQRRTGSWRSAIQQSMTPNKTEKPTSAELTRILGRTWSTLPHAMHAMVLSSILLFASHVQIALRLSSSIPYMYWAAAQLLMDDEREEGVHDAGERLAPTKLRRKWGRIWVFYAVIWGVISSVLWATFLPPA
ncbi:ER membrane glycoprotein subunit of the GPI transamidase complex-like protein [Tulasnella sp. JGI-2019a]|nr:ER membrane glycoprotein subunit of the GPI transamidase complex-like protein [Tulasnella sp. JGI-2019a]KAG8996544.1 ER membrane glycoprotein subunit of the GPI transamidase complex-like protein [Tulasnella sp. JGI-2019a]